MIPLGIVWMAAAVSVRVSIILFCVQIFPVRRFKIICWILVAVNIAGLVSVVLGLCLICKPIHYAFDKTIPGGHCGNLTAFGLYPAILSLILDLMIVVLPLPILWKLQMQTKRKIELSVVFGMGLM